VTDLHGWITQQIDTIERELRDGKTVLDEHGRYHHTEIVNDPVLLRRCAADRKILAIHEPVGGACDGCGFDRDDGYFVDDINDCPTLLALAEGYGLTNTQRATLDRPELERPVCKPRGPMPDTSRVPAALRGPNWRPTSKEQA
jgi:hypothetical protein